MTVLGYHAVFCTYGFWLPNDPRGSWSDFVRKWDLLHFGQATKTNARQSVADKPHDRNLRKRAKSALANKPVQLSGKQALAVGRGFNKACKEGGYSIHASSILPEHVHLVIARNERKVEHIVRHLKTRATQALKERPVWARGCWKVFLNTDKEFMRAIEYVINNPEKEGKKRQTWPFVCGYPR
jgi:REP element-mobilizing transposase RayT